MSVEENKEIFISFIKDDLKQEINNSDNIIQEFLKLTFDNQNKLLNSITLLKKVDKRLENLSKFLDDKQIIKYNEYLDTINKLQYNTLLTILKPNKYLSEYFLSLIKALKDKTNATMELTNWKESN